MYDIWQDISSNYWVLGRSCTDDKNNSTTHRRSKTAISKQNWGQILDWHHLSLIPCHGQAVQTALQEVSDYHISSSGRGSLTSIGVLQHRVLDGTLVRRRRRLDLHAVARRCTKTAAVHEFLESIALPPKDIVGVLGIARLVAVAQNKGLRAVGGPLAFVVERRCVPDNLEHNLGDLDGVGGRAGGRRGK